MAIAFIFVRYPGLFIYPEDYILGAGYRLCLALYFAA